MSPRQARTLLDAVRVKTAVACVLLSMSACVADSGDDGDVVDVIVGDGKADTSTTVHLSSGHSTTVQFTAPGTAIDVTVDCGAPENPDIVGMQFTFTSSALGQPTASDPVADFWQWSGDVDAGPAKLRLRGKTGSGTCTVSIKSIAGSCTAATSYHSPATGHTHLYVGTENPEWGEFPVAGDHWGSWAKWNSIYLRPVLMGFLLHSLEHGGIVLSYNCSSPSESDECKQAANDLVALKKAFGEPRVIVTPDPNQPTRYGVRAWRYAFQSDCYDEDRMLDFMTKRFRHGREDIEDSPPIPYDPTTMDVPCQDLMAAPDSCN
jgi:hypothetical protein